MFRFLKILADWFYDRFIYPLTATDGTSDRPSSSEKKKRETR